MKGKQLLALAACIVAVVICYIVANIDFSALNNLTIENTLILLLLSLLPLIVFIFALRILLRSMGYDSSMRMLYLITTSSLAANYTSPVKVGIPLRIYMYKKFLQIPFTHATALLTVEVFFEFLLPALISIIAILTLFTEYNLQMPFFTVLFLFMSFYVLLYTKPKKLEGLILKLPFQSRLNRLRGFGVNFQEGINRMNQKSLVLFILLLLLIYAVSAFQSYILLVILGVEVNPLHLLYVNMISFTVGIISTVPMGFGTKDASLIFLLLKIGVPNEIAISAALIQRILGTGLDLLLGVFSASVLGIKFLGQDK